MGRFANILSGTAQKTNEQLASEISSLTRLTDTEISSLAPDIPDKEKLLELLEIVNDATEENKKIRLLKQKIDSLAGIVVNLIKILA